MGVPLAVFGGIFLLITLFVGPRLQNEVEAPWCPNDVQGVADNKKWYKRFLIISSTMVAVGILLILLKI